MWFRSHPGPQNDPKMVHLSTFFHVIFHVIFHDRFHDIFHAVFHVVSMQFSMHFSGTFLGTILFIRLADGVGTHSVFTASTMTLLFIRPALGVGTQPFHCWTPPNALVLYNPKLSPHPPPISPYGPRLGPCSLDTHTNWTLARCSPAWWSPKFINFCRHKFKHMCTHIFWSSPFNLAHESNFHKMR